MAVPYAHAEPVSANATSLVISPAARGSCRRALTAPCALQPSPADKGRVDASVVLTPVVPDLFVRAAYGYCVSFFSLEPFSCPLRVWSVGPMSRPLSRPISVHLRLRAEQRLVAVNIGRPVREKPSRLAPKALAAEQASKADHREVKAAMVAGRNGRGTARARLRVRRRTNWAASELLRPPASSANTTSRHLCERSSSG